jgi:hypothetical protein
MLLYRWGDGGRLRRFTGSRGADGGLVE